MAAEVSGVLNEDLSTAIRESKVLVVGAGGIGCELLKNLVLCGFRDIEIIDLDTIDVSNLNRQFLFRKQHVGKSKAEVARESALLFNPNAKIKHHHDSIIGNAYNINFFKRFAVVMNALDNRAARNHVNRMCLAADIPLIESGTAGFDGQVELIKKGMTRCYECEPKAAQKTFPGCTIRNTPSEPIHCIVWAKHLFNQLFGEEDADQNVSPDTEDPEAAGDAGEKALGGENNGNATVNGNVHRKSTREWAEECNYDPEKLFQKLFHDDIKYLLSMDKLWVTRRRPVPMEWHHLPDAVAGCSQMPDPGLKDLRQWSVAECGTKFEESVQRLKVQMRRGEEVEYLSFDKDDQDAMDFVTACTNIRAHIFGIKQVARFEVKAMAGNIIPAIATTNAIVAGIVVLHAFQVLQRRLEKCQTVYVRPKPNHRKQLLVPEKYLNPPVRDCYICSEKPEVSLMVNVNKMTVKELEDQVLKKALHMAAPDVILELTGTVVISSEEGETEENNEKTLCDIGILDGCILKVDDFLQNYELTVYVHHYEAAKDAPEFRVVADPAQLRPKASETPADAAPDADDSDDLVLVETPKKRKLEDDQGEEADQAGTAPKKAKTVEDPFSDSSDADIIIL